LRILGEDGRELPERRVGEIALAGPEIRLRGALEPGKTRFDGGEPVIEGESRNG